MTGADADVEGLRGLLSELRAAAPEVTAAVLATHSGLPLAADAGELDAHAIAALGADLLGVSATVSATLAGGEPREATVRGPDARVIALAAGQEAVLVALTDALTPASSVLPDLREAAERLAEAL